MSTAALLHREELASFELPDNLIARVPPESRGLRRDQVRLMVTSAEDILHLDFAELPTVLRPGDALVVNNSATIPAAVDIDQRHTLHFSTKLPGDLLLVEPRLRTGAGSARRFDTSPGVISLPGGTRLELLAPYPAGSESRRLWLATADLDMPLQSFLADHGRPITYHHSAAHLPLAMYQTVFTTEPGSAEMPSAGRPFSQDLVTRLVSAGVLVVPITLHAGVSSLESGEAPYAEWYHVGPTTARLLNHSRRAGGRVIAVGTTVVRALETVTDSQGRTHPGSGWTDLIVGRGHQVQSIDGVITGWHEPMSSHLDMLEAVAGRAALAASYEQALDSRYLWHEFGDSLLVLR